MDDIFEILDPETVTVEYFGALEVPLFSIEDLALDSLKQRFEILEDD